MLAQVGAEDDQSERFFRCEIGGRQEVVLGDSVALLFLVEEQRHARLPKDVEIAKDRPSAYFTGGGEALNVLTSSSLKQTDQFEQATNSGQVHWSPLLWPGLGSVWEPRS